MSYDLTDSLLAELASQHGTPLYVLDLDRVRAQVARLSGFDRVRYAQKANPGLALLRALRAEGLSVDATSAGELLRAERAGFSGSDIELTADVFSPETLAAAASLGVRANLGSADQLEPYAATGLPDCTLRINPGFGAGHDAKVTTGGAHSKHGIWHEELEATCERAARCGLSVSGLHVHIGSGADLANLERTVQSMGELLRRAPSSVVRVSAGGGLPVPYRAAEVEFPVERYAQAWRSARDDWQKELGRSLELEVEPGRYLVAQAGVLVTTVLATKRTPDHEWVLVDAGFNTLARPMLYGAFHRMRALGRDGEPLHPRMVAGPLCEAADVFTQDKGGLPAPQQLPEVRPGDRLVVHDTGAYGISMASTYNGFPLPAEVLVERGTPRLVRRRQSLEELLEQEESET